VREVRGMERRKADLAVGGRRRIDDVRKAVGRYLMGTEMVSRGSEGF
jgi:hypothetical protein